MKHLYNLSNQEFKKYVAMLKGQAKKSARGQRLFEQVVLKRGYKFGEGYKYKGATKKVNLICPKGHSISITPTNFKDSGAGCAKCAGKCPEQARELFEARVLERGYKFNDSYEWNGTTKKVDLICPKGHPISIIPTNFKKSGRNCKTCANAERDEYYRQQVEANTQQALIDSQRPYIIKDYINSNNITLECSVHNTTFKTTLSQIQQSSPTCPGCKAIDDESRHRHTPLKQRLSARLKNKEMRPFADAYIYDVTIGGIDKYGFVKDYGTGIESALKRYQSNAAGTRTGIGYNNEPIIVNKTWKAPRIRVVDVEHIVHHEMQNILLLEQPRPNWAGGSNSGCYNRENVHHLHTRTDELLTASQETIDDLLIKYGFIGANMRGAVDFENKKIRIKVVKAARKAAGDVDRAQAEHKRLERVKINQQKAQDKVAAFVDVGIAPSSSFEYNFKGHVISAELYLSSPARKRKYPDLPTTAIVVRRYGEVMVWNQKNDIDGVIYSGVNSILQAIADELQIDTSVYTEKSWNATQTRIIAISKALSA